MDFADSSAPFRGDVCGKSFILFESRDPFSRDNRACRIAACIAANRQAKRLSRKSAQPPSTPAEQKAHGCQLFRPCLFPLTRFGWVHSGTLRMAHAGGNVLRKKSEGRRSEGERSKGKRSEGPVSIQPRSERSEGLGLGKSSMNPSSEGADSKRGEISCLF